MTCCQVPSVSSPATMGMVSEGPSRLARMWLWPLPSCQRALWAYSRSGEMISSKSLLRSLSAPLSNSIVVMPLVEEGRRP